MSPSVAILVLNWNQCKETLKCFEALTNLNYPQEQLELILVDNGSTEELAEVTWRFPQLTLLQNDENRGYAGGNNVGITYALQQNKDYICILNNDVIVDPDFLTPLLEVLESDKQVGVVTPLIAHLRQPETIWTLGQTINFNTAIVSRCLAGETTTSLTKADAFDVDATSGAAMVVRRGVFEEVGLLDEEFFLYYEEVDWSIRVRRGGFKIKAVPESIVWHRVSNTLGKDSPIIDYYMLRNHLRLIALHWHGVKKYYLLTRITLKNIIHILAFTIKSHDGKRLIHRNARLYALRDALLGRGGQWMKT